MSNQDNRQNEQGRVAVGDWKRELMNLLQLKGRVSSGKRKQKPISDRTLDSREAVLFMCMNQVREMGYDIKSVYSLRGRHVEALVEKWKTDGVGAGAIQNRLSILRALSKWIGKDGLVLPSRRYALDAPGRLRRQVSATDDKSWTAKGIDPERVFVLVAGMDHYVAMQLRLMDAFGLRREEAIQFKPNVCHESGQLRIRDGTKGGRERMVPVESDKQRKVLEEAKRVVTRWDGAVAAPGHTLKQNLNRFDYVMQRTGLTKKGLGITSHGLRHQRLNDIFEEVAGVPSPVRQMSGVTVIVKGDPAKWKQAQQKVSSIAGHARLNIAGAYTGSAKSVKKPRLDWTAGLNEERVEAGRQSFERCAYPCRRIKAIEFGGGQQTLNRGGPFAGAFRSGEEPVLLPESDRPDGVLHRIVERPPADDQLLARPCIRAQAFLNCESCATSDRQSVRYRTHRVLGACLILVR